MKDKKIAVTGGAGFLGSHVVRLLIEKENKVVVLDDFSNGKMNHLDAVRNDPHLEIIKGDMRNLNTVQRAFDGCQIIFHLAVLDLRQSIREPHLVNEVNVKGTLNCLDVALRNEVELFLNCSSSEVYGTAVYIPMNEKHPFNPETPYAASKVAQDMYVHSYGQTYGLPWVTVRPFNMYGPNSHWQGVRGELIPKMIVRAMNRSPLVIFGDGEQTRDFVYVEEAARALIAAAEASSCRNKCLNYCSGVETSVRRIAELVCNHFQLDPKRFIHFEPRRPGDVRRHLGDPSEFTRLIGAKPLVELEKGLALTIRWFGSLPFSPKELLSADVVRNWE